MLLGEIEMEYSYNYSAREMEQILKKNGFALIRVKGSHKIYKNGNRMAVMPVRLKKSIAVSIIKSCQLVI